MIGEIKIGKCSVCNKEKKDVLDVHGFYYCSKCYKENSTKLTIKFRSDEKNLKMIRCRNAVHKMVKEGKLVPEKCAVCGKLPTQAHHDDYNKPLNVIWLCRKHHGEIHRNYTLQEALVTE